MLFAIELWLKTVARRDLMATEESIGVKGLLCLYLNVLDKDITLSGLNHDAFMLDNIYDLTWGAFTISGFNGFGLQDL